MDEKLDTTEKIIGYKFVDRNILWEALQVAGSGVTKAGARSITNGNKRLALLGDRAREMVLCDAWYASGDPEVMYATANKTLSSRISDAHVCHLHGLAACINVNATNPVEPTINILSALLEAVLGAVYLDCGRRLAPVSRVMTTLGIVYGWRGVAELGAAGVVGEPEFEFAAQLRGSNGEVQFM